MILAFHLELMGMELGEFIVDRVSVDKMLLIKLRRLDRFDSEAKHLKSKHEARRAIEDYNEQKRLDREFEF